MDYSNSPALRMGWTKWLRSKEYSTEREKKHNFTLVKFVSDVFSKVIKININSDISHAGGIYPWYDIMRMVPYWCVLFPQKNCNSSVTMRKQQTNSNTVKFSIYLTSILQKIIKKQEQFGKRRNLRWSDN